MSVRYLVVDDDDAFRDRLIRAIRSRGVEVHGAHDGEAALALMRMHAFERVITDLKMPGISGVELVPALLAINPAVRIVVLTGYGSIATTVQCVRRGAVNYLTKPVEVDYLLAAFDAVAEPSVAHFATPSLASVEWNHIQRVLDESEGNVSRAARTLGLHRRSLQRKLQKIAR